MNQKNYINDSKVEGNVYNEKINYVTLPKSYRRLMWCSETKTDNSGITFGKSCFVFIAEKKQNTPNPKQAYTNYKESPDLDYNFKDLYEDSKWDLKEIALRE